MDEMIEKDNSETKFQNLSQYLSPDWVPSVGSSNVDESPVIQYPEYQLTDDKTNQTLSIIELVATELHSYLLFYLHEIDIQIDNQEIAPNLVELIQQNAIENSNYCRKIVTWVLHSHLPSNLKTERLQSNEEIENYMVHRFNKLCDEYMKYSPGPWREGVLIEAIRGAFFPILCRELILYLQERHSHFISQQLDSQSNTNVNVNDQTLSVSVSEGDDDTLHDSNSSIIASGVDHSNFIKTTPHPERDFIDFDSISSVGYQDDLGDQSLKNRGLKKKYPVGSSAESVSSRRSIPKNLPPKASQSHHTLNKFKAEIAMLQNQLVKAEAADKVMLQEKLREYRVDLDVLRERNSELSTRVQELDLKLFQSLVTPLQTKLTHQLPPKLTHQRRRRTTPTRRLGVEPEEDQFEDAKEEASQMTNTDSEDKHSNAAEVDHEFDDSHSASRDHLVLLDHPSHPSPSSSPQQQQLSSEEDVKSLISLYENQFEKMKDEIRHLQLLVKRPQSGNVTASVLKLQHPHHHAAHLLETHLVLTSPLLSKENKKISSVAAISPPPVPEAQERAITAGAREGGEDARRGKLYSKRQVDKLIAAAVESSQEIDQRTIREMINEIKELNSTVKLQEQRLQQCQQQLASRSPDLQTTPAPLLTAASSLSKTQQTQRKDDSNSSGMLLVYSFLWGNLVMLFVSTVFPWMLFHGSSFLSSLWNSLSSSSIESESSEDSEL